MQVSMKTYLSAHLPVAHPLFLFPCCCFFWPFAGTFSIPLFASGHSISFLGVLSVLLCLECTLCGMYFGSVST